MAQLVIEHVPISDLKEWGDNPRHHNVEAIRRSMERFGIRWPIIVNRNTMQVEAGHGRLKALRELGETEVPVLFVDDDHLTAKAFAIADNRTQELTQWDEQGLADVLTDEHGTQKPIGLVRRSLLFSPNGIVADLFLGSGTTLIAAEQTGRICYGMEIVPYYCDVAIARWEAFTGGQAVLVEEREMAYA